MSGAGPTLSYTLPPGQGISPESVSVNVNGSGAASDFVVQLTIADQDGNIISRTRTDDTVTAGTSGVATFAPF